MDIGEQGYRNILRRCLNEGEDDFTERTGVGTRRIFGQLLRFNLSDGQAGLLTGKKIVHRIPHREILWMISGDTNIRSLVQNNVTIWSDWPHAKYVAQTGDDITQEEFNRRINANPTFARTWGDLGPVYGHQWRKWRGKAVDAVRVNGHVVSYKYQEIDQLQNAINQIRTAPSGRRILVDSWSPADIGEMALPPCHYSFQFTKMPSGKLNLGVTLRKH